MKINTLPLICTVLLLAGCTSAPQHDNERRSIIYKGQPVSDVYNNFGAPTGLQKYSDTSFTMIYKKQDIDTSFAVPVVRDCTLAIYINDNQVIDYDANGNACVVHEENASRYNANVVATQQTMVPTVMRSYDAGNYIHRVQQDAFEPKYGNYGTQIQPQPRPVVQPAGQYTQPAGQYVQPAQIVQQPIQKATPQLPKKPIFDYKQYRQNYIQDVRNAKTQLVLDEFGY